MGKYLSLLFLSSLLLMPMIGAVGLQNTSTSINSDFVISDVIDFERGPTVNHVTNNSATIFWRTEAAADSTVDYGLNTSLLESKSNTTLVIDHYITLPGLEAVRLPREFLPRGTRLLLAPASGEEKRNHARNRQPSFHLAPPNTIPTRDS